ncbi:hypothetical protein SYK_27340 [Pseudodesulfovibrio nedwellii]|uniref:Peptidoglycan binding-like domain-containing protein n=1 Tax=Pseudodesulfovibrio nedwellii TaxID=2973072 RepID=A0ABN6S565_9BACT|nr:MULTISPECIES: peptidoglycan-binding domain-containing protein [Pseudodesulfovibrio]BDQ38374.1 hypothetical protein SYK_27340 [Pseudodesulfovibrio nedwellii]
MRKYTVLTILVLFSLALTACKMDGLGSTPPPPPPKKVQTPEVIPVKQEQAPDDIKLVTSALLERLRGGKIAVENVTFDPAGRHAVGEKEFDYEGFDVQNVAVTGYETTVLNQGEVLVMLEGVFLFKDVINRRAGVYYAAQYVVTKRSVNITKSVVVGIPPDFPRVETFFVKEKTFKAVASTLTSYMDYYLFAIENAEPMTYGEDGSRTGIKSKYFIMTFCKDRLFQESSLAMKVTSRAYGAGTKLADAISINDSGWRILIAGGEFTPGSSKSRFYVGVTYKQDPTGYLPAVVVGEFANVKKDRTEAPPAPVAAVAAPAAPATASPAPASVAAPAPAIAAPAPAMAAPAPAIAAPAPAAIQSAPTDGPLGAGRAFLNPVFPEDVKVMQVRLRELGYYKGKIDQNFGPLTKQALDNFAVKYGFPKGQWSLGVQKALFKGTGL